MQICAMDFSNEASASARVFQISELLEHIIHLLQDERFELLSSTLVCKSWDLVASQHLFQSICVDPLLYVRPLPDSNGLCEPKYFSLKRSSRITHNVRDLSFGVYGSDDRDTATWVFDDVIRLDVIPTDVLGDAISTFPGLRRLRLGMLSLYNTETLQMRLDSVGQYTAPILLPPSEIYLDTLTLELEAFESDAGHASASLPSILALLTGVRSMNLARLSARRVLEHGGALTYSSRASYDDWNREPLLHRSLQFFEPRTHILHQWISTSRWIKSTAVLERKYVHSQVPACTELPSTTREQETQCYKALGPID